VNSIKKVCEDTYIIQAELIDPLPIVPKPFQFFMIWIPRVEELPMSIADLRDDTVSFLFRVRGKGTRALASLKNNSFIGLKGPLGKGLNIKPNTKILAIAGGIGIAPIPYLVRVSRSLHSKVHILWGVKRGSEIFSLENTFDLGNLGISIATEDCSIGFCGTVIDLAQKVLEIENFDDVIFVGPNPMLKEACLRFQRLNPWVSLETIVKCGIGFCGSCSLPPTPYLLCVDGPVFRCSQVIDYLLNYT